MRSVIHGRPTVVGVGNGRRVAIGSGSMACAIAAALDHKAQRAMCPAYITGLIGPGDHKSVQPMAARSSDIPYGRLHHFVSAGV